MSRFLIGLLLLASIAGCQRQQQPDRKEQLTVFVSILPLAYFAQQLGQEQLSVEVLVGPGQSPATYEPSPHQLTQLSRAALLFRIGVPFERALIPRLPGLAPQLSVVDTRQGIALIKDQEQPQGHQGEADPHVWLDPQRAQQIARTMAAALVRKDPRHASLYRQRLQQLEQELSALDHELAGLLQPLAGQPIFVYHGAYSYFCQRYRLQQIDLEQGGKESGAKQLALFIAQARRHAARALFVQPQYSRKEAEAVARAIGAKVVSLDPLSRRYPRDLRALAHTVRTYLAATPEETTHGR